MGIKDILGITASTKDYNFHSHTQLCDGHASMEEMMEGALRAGMLHYGFSPHSPVSVESPCNMKREDLQPYLDEVLRLQESLAESGESLCLYAGMEIDYITDICGPDMDYYRELPLDYRIGSVHFVTSQEGIPIDCDGGLQRFRENLKNGFRGDLRYVVEKYFESVLYMLERGGFDILGHADKIAANASGIDKDIESYQWYQSLIDDVVRLSADKGVIVEINTKSLADRGRFFPHHRLWKDFYQAGAPLIVNSDAHYPEKIQAGREEAFIILQNEFKLN